MKSSSTAGQQSGRAKRVVVVNPRPNLEKLQDFIADVDRALAAASIGLTFKDSWTDDCASADLIIGIDPMGDRPVFSDLKILGQKTLTRLDVLQFAKEMAAPVARFGSPANQDELSSLSYDWGEFAVLKYDWSARRTGVFLWPLGSAQKPFPSDFKPGFDHFMEFADTDPTTYKIEAFAGVILGAWALPTRSMRESDWQVLTGVRQNFSPPSELREPIEKVSRALLRFGVGHASFDLMRADAGFRIIEINSHGVGTSAWSRWPDQYASTLSDAIVRALKHLDEIPRFGDLRARAQRAGNEGDPAVLREQNNASRLQSVKPATVTGELLFHNSLIDSERLPSARFDQFWRQAANKLLSHCSRTVPFYRDRLKHVIRWDGTIDWGKWSDIPPLTRVDVMSDRHSLLSRDVPAFHGPMINVRTAGTTGERIVLSQSGLHLAAASCMDARLYRWHGIDQAENMASLWPGIGQDLTPDRTWAPKWLPLPHGRELRGDGTMPADEQLRWLGGLGQIYLRTRPSLARSLALAVRANPELKPQMKGLLTQGEIVTDDVRRLCRTYLGHNPIDAYHVVEAGLVALTCPMGSYHLQTDVCLTEVVRSNGRPCDPGEIGEVLVTPLYNLTMPLIRYATGDLAELPARIECCACGRSLPMIKRVIGRRRNMLHFEGEKSGQPDVNSELVVAYLGARQWQLAQVGPRAAELQFVTELPDAELQCGRAEQYIRQLLPPGISLRLRRTERLSSSHTGRHENYLYPEISTAAFGVDQRELDR
jgi:phenylacetate-CoA ligase